LGEAATLLRQGELVAFPTETVYGLGANALSATAVRGIFTAKGRPSDNPLIVHVHSAQALAPLLSDDVNSLLSPTVDQAKSPSDMASLRYAHLLQNAFWPGPLTLLFPRSSAVPDVVTASLPSVAVRVPSHPVARLLLRLADCPVAAPSANISGRPSPTQASHVLQDLNGRIAAVVDGGSTEVGLESTVVDLGRDPPLVLRPGGITLEQLRAVVPDIQLYRKRLDEGALVLAPPTPGLKYRHYSPSGHVMLLLPSLAKNRSDTEKKSMETRTLDVVRVQLDEGHRVGILQTTPELSLSSELLQAQKENRLVVLTLGDPSNPRKIAQNVFAALREMDDRQVNVIIVQGISEENEGYAVMNRLRKAASTLLKDAK